MDNLILKDINQTEIVINASSDTDIANHFSKNETYGLHILNQINNGGCDILKKLIPKDSICLDIGANVGLVTLWLASNCKAIHCFEPNSVNFKILQKITSSLPNVTLHQVALYAEDTEIPFYTCEYNTTMNSLIDFSKKKNYEMINSKRLDTIVNDLNETVNFCKIDIEGSEIIALTDEILTNCKNKIKSYYLEIHDTEQINSRSQLDNLDYFTSIFKNLNYTVERVTHMVDNTTIICY